jgi:hypothetical protein
MSLFEERYGKVVAADPDTQDSPSSQAYRVSRFLREHTPPGSGLAVFGQEYSSEVAFHSQRKTITVPPWFKEYRQVWTSPEKYLGNVPLAGIVLCPPGKDFPTSSDMRQREKDEAGWARFRVEGCDVLLKIDATQPKDAR